MKTIVIDDNIVNVDSIDYETKLNNDYAPWVDIFVWSYDVSVSGRVFQDMQHEKAEVSTTGLIERREEIQIAMGRETDLKDK